MSDNDGDLFCDRISEILEAVGGKDADAKKEIEEGKVFKEEKSVESFLRMYEKENNNVLKYGSVIRGLRKLVCSHPLEWDKEIYKSGEFRDKLSMQEVRYKKQEEEIELLDIWKGGSVEGIKEAVGNPASNNFWFAHPLYFIDHLDKADLLDKTFNPYLGIRCGNYKPSGTNTKQYTI